MYKDVGASCSVTSLIEEFFAGCDAFIVWDVGVETADVCCDDVCVFSNV